MTTKKYVKTVHDTYLPKVRYLIDVVNTCITEEQVSNCISWGNSLINEWIELESRKIDNFITWFSWQYLSMELEMRFEMEKFRTIFETVYCKKFKEVNGKEF